MPVLSDLYFLTQICDSFLMRENVGQIKPIFWHILHSIFSIQLHLLQNVVKHEIDENKWDKALKRENKEIKDSVKVKDGIYQGRRSILRKYQKAPVGSWSKVFLQPAPLPGKECIAYIFRNFLEKLFLQDAT